uniref:Retrovirus-related Pol polyprotein from transposon TNT 1-94 n=1 Tax=Cajanus cajan TaxID=3821 RepID=A0A151QZZ1_CAJCA|nr:Retrovirus-related Pol polyprotein from transposon TNT 1-94 [Cajanus cajan]
MEAYLEALHLWEAVEEDYDVSKLADNPTVAQMKIHKEKKIKKTKAKSCLFACVSQNVFHHDHDSQIGKSNQEEERQQREKTKSAHLASNSQNRKRKNNKDIVERTSQQKKVKKNENTPTCFFCKKSGHMKEECPKYPSWRVKKGNFLSFVCFGVNFAFVPHDTWWVDSGATTHISVSMQGCLWSRLQSDDERFIYVGDGNKVTVEAIGTVPKETNLASNSALIMTLKEPYVLAVGSLMYAQVCTRPDIAFIVGVLGRYLSNPGMQHWKEVKPVMRYLKRTKGYMLTYQKSNSLEIIGYSDSNFSGCQDSKRSTCGSIFMLVEGVISWKSVKQTIIASSTMVSEFIACFEASNHGI